MNRRRFLSSALRTGSATFAAPLARALDETTPASPILDAHVHLFDPTRPGGIPWPKSDDSIYRPATPDRLRSLAAPLGVVGAIAIEASPLNSDNDWLLQIVEQHPFMVGFIGNLVPGSPNFHADLDRLHRSPLFLGIRYGNLWDRDLAADLADAHRRIGFLADLRLLAQAGLTFESANPNPALITALLDVAQSIPDLRIVIDHLPHMQPPADPAEQQPVHQQLHLLAQSPNVFVKLSEILTASPGNTQTSSAPYRAQLDPLWSLFGPDRILFGSDWPNGDHIASYAETLAVAQDYVRLRAPAAAAPVFFRNSQRAYRWLPRPLTHS